MRLNSTKLFLLSALSIGAGGCYEEPKAVPHNFTITAYATSVEANGLDAARIVLQIDPSETENINARSITVTTSLGYFGENKQTTSTTATTDAAGKASVYIKSDQVGNAVVQANIGTLVYRTTEITFTPAVVVVKITPESTALEADGISTSRIKVEVTKANVKSARQITLNTNIGSFANAQTSISLTTDTTGSAYTYLKSDVPGTATLTAALGTEASSQAEVQFTPKVVTITVIPTATTIEADGATTARIDVSITKAPVKAAKSITLTTTLGSFANGQPNITLTTNDLGNTYTYLKGSAPGKAIVTAALGTDATAQAEVTFIPKTVTITIETASATLEADGVTSTKVLVRITKGTLLAGQTLLLSTTLGTFVNGQPSQSLMTAADGSAYTYIKGDMQGLAIVTASLGNESVNSTEINFLRASPDLISVSTEVLEATSGAGNLLSVTVHLSRNTGKPSTGFIPRVEAFDNTNTTIGVFTAASPSGTDGKSMVKFAIPDKTFAGPVTFRATVEISDAPPLISDQYGPVTFVPGN